MGAIGGGERYRLMVFDRPAGPWRSERDQALNDAIACRLGSREAWSKVTYLDVGAWIQVAKAQPGPAATAGRPGPMLREVADLSGKANGMALGAVAANDTRPGPRVRNPRARGRG